MGYSICIRTGSLAKHYYYWRDGCNKSQQVDTTETYKNGSGL